MTSAQSVDVFPNRVYVLSRSKENYFCSMSRFPMLLSKKLSKKLSKMLRYELFILSAGLAPYDSRMTNMLICLQHESSNSTLRLVL